MNCVLNNANVYMYNSIYNVHVHGCAVISVWVYVMHCAGTEEDEGGGAEGVP